MSNRLRWPPKDPSDVLDYRLDWSARLDGDTILTSTWVAPAGFTVTSQSFTATTATVWLSGGTVDVAHLIQNTITTAGGRTFEVSVELRVDQL